MNRSLPLRRLAVVLTLVAAAAAVTSSAASAENYMSTIQSTGPLAHWGMGEPSGNVAWDSVGSYHATFPMTMYGITRGVRGGVAGGGADPLATHIAPRDWMTAPLSQGWWNGRGAFSANVWLRWDGYVYDDYNNPLAAGIIGNLNFSYQVGGWGLDIPYDSPSRVRMIRHRYGAPVATTSSVPIPVGEWTMLTAVYDGLALNLYQDGRHVGHVVDSSLQSNGYNSLYVGAQDYNLFFSGYFGPGKGAYDEISVWSRALTAQEIEEIYDSARQAPKIIFVPGIAGSELEWDGPGGLDITVWPNAVWEFPAIAGLEVRENGEESSHTVTATKVLDEIRAPPFTSTTKIYKKALDTFTSWAAQGALDEFKPLPYDWRLGVRNAATDLLYEIVERCEEGPLWLVGHSTGGLVVKRALRRMRELGLSPERCFDGGGVFFLATPHAGAPKAIGTMINPDHFFDEWKQRLAAQQRPFANVVNDWLTGWELMPRRAEPPEQPAVAREDWFDTGNDGLADMNVNGDQLNWVLDEKARLSHEQHDAAAATVGALPVYNVLGYRSVTPNSYTPGTCVRDWDLGRQWEELDRNAELDGTAPGDGTVPLWSALWPGSPLQPASYYAVPDTKHVEIANDDAVLALISTVLSSEAAAYPHWPSGQPGYLHSTSPALIAQLRARAQRTWIVRTCSPVATLASLDGSETGIRPDGTVVEDIPNSLVTVTGEAGDNHSVIVVPDEEDGRVPEYSLAATGDGPASIWIDEPDGSQHDFVFSVRTGDRGTIRVAGGDWELAVDRGGDGTVDETLVENHPVVRLADPPRTVLEGGEVEIAAEAKSYAGDDVRYEWSLVSGNGSLTADGARGMYHAGDGPSEARVRVEAVDEHGRSASVETTIAVENVVPAVDAGSDRSSPWGVPVTLDGAASDPSAADTAAGLGIRWTFGDGAEATTPATSHTWLTPGPYTARLTATDKDGGTATDEAAVSVTRRTAALRSEVPASVPYGTRVFAGRLADSVDPATASLGGHRLTFSVGGSDLPSDSDAAGRAFVELALPLDAGAHDLAIALAGDDAFYSASPVQATVRVEDTRGGAVGALEFPSGARVALVVASDGNLVRGFLLWRAPDGSTLSVPNLTAYGGDGTTAWFAGTTAAGARVVVNVVERVGPERLSLWVNGEPVAGAGDASEGVVAVASG
jgi:Concanavalin A-like lectin/glucanases superfamily/PKD domain